MQQLVEGMLAVGAGLAPEDLAGIGGHSAAVPADVLAVGLHGELLQVGRETVQILAVRKHGVALGAEEVDVPDVEQAHQRDGVALERRVAEVLVDGMEALEELLEALGAEHDDQRQAHGGVDRIAAANPVPEAEGVAGSIPKPQLSSAVERRRSALPQPRRSAPRSRRWHPEP